MSNVILYILCSSLALAVTNAVEKSEVIQSNNDKYPVFNTNVIGPGIAIFELKNTQNLNLELQQFNIL